MKKIDIDQLKPAYEGKLTGINILKSKQYPV